MRRVWLLILIVVSLLSPASALAQDGKNEIGRCVSQGKVWLFIIDDSDKVLVNQCAGAPGTGEDILRQAEVPLGIDSKGFICQMGSHPKKCPKKFKGQFWNYYHAQPGHTWEFSKKGAREYDVPAGSIEAWCYNKRGTKNCTPPVLRVMIDGKPVLSGGVAEKDLKEYPLARGADLPTPPPDTSLIVTIIVSVVAIAVVAATIVVYLRVSRRDRAGGAVGGR